MLVSLYIFSKIFNTNDKEKQLKPSEAIFFLKGYDLSSCLRLVVSTVRDK